MPERSVFRHWGIDSGRLCFGVRRLTPQFQHDDDGFPRTSLPADSPWSRMLKAIAAKKFPDKKPVEVQTRQQRGEQGVLVDEELPLLVWRGGKDKVILF